MCNSVQKNNLYTTKGGLLIKVDTIGDGVVYSNDTISVKEFSHIPSVKELELAPSIKVDSVRLWERIENLNEIPITKNFGLACGFVHDFDWKTFVLEVVGLMFTVGRCDDGTLYINPQSLSDGAQVFRRIYSVSDFQNIYRALFLKELPIDQKFIKEYGRK